MALPACSVWLQMGDGFAILQSGRLLHRSPGAPGTGQSHAGSPPRGRAGRAPVPLGGPVRLSPWRRDAGARNGSHAKARPASPFYDPL